MKKLSIYLFILSFTLNSFSQIIGTRPVGGDEVEDQEKFILATIESMERELRTQVNKCLPNTISISQKDSIIDIKLKLELYFADKKITENCNEEKEYQKCFSKNKPLSISTMVFVSKPATVRSVLRRKYNISAKQSEQVADFYERLVLK